ncbi:MAG: hypothetical protein Q9188_006379 [Gyalolechia gomerana]
MVVWIAQGRNLPRDNPKTYNVQDGTVYAPYDATCAADGYISNPFGRTSPVTVRPDCDAAISVVCTRAVADYQKGREFDMRNIRASFGDTNKCEATMMFSTPKLDKPIDYQSCVGVFQMITVGCMLVQEGSSGSPGQQAGVVNVEYSAQGGDWNTTYPMMKASERFSNDPGFMVGPPGYFGNRSYGVDISGVYSS